MRFFAPLRGRWVSLCVIAVAQGIVGLVFGAVASLPWTHVLRLQPDGERALYSEGGRFTLDLVRHQSVGIETGVFAALVGVGLWASVWFVLGGVMPALFAADEAPMLHRAMASSVRRAPTLAALASMAGIGYAVAGVIAALGWSHANHRALSIVNIRAADLLHVYTVLPAVAVALAVTVWHDVARTHAMADGARSLAAAGAAVTRMLRAPHRTLGLALVYALVGLLGPAVALGASTVFGGREGSLALVTLVLVQQTAVGWRLMARALWFASLGTPRASPRLDTP